jgi:hypothetical protein
VEAVLAPGQGAAGTGPTCRALTAAGCRGVRPALEEVSSGAGSPGQQQGREKWAALEHENRW